MMKIVEWIKKNFTYKYENWSQISTSMNSLAVSSGFNRRKNSRVLYPNANFSAVLPQIVIGERVQKAVDISVGGVCIESEEDQTEFEVGQIFQLHFRWLLQPQAVVQAKVVGQSFKKIHLQFLNLPAEIHEKLKTNLKPGIIGRNFTPTYYNENINVTTDYEELWVGIENERLIVFDIQQKYIELNFLEKTYHLFNNVVPKVYDKNGQEVAFCERHLSEILILLSNITAPSDSIKEIILSLENSQIINRGAS